MLGKQNNQFLTAVAVHAAPSKAGFLVNQVEKIFLFF